MNRSPARFIPGEEIGAVTEWDFGDVDKASARFAAKLAAQALAEEQAKVAQARSSSFAEGSAQGHAQGYAEGFAQGHTQATIEGQRLLDDYIANEGRLLAENFARLFAAAQSELMHAEQAMAVGVLELSCAIARQVLRTEITTDPNVLQPVIREALGMLVLDHKAAVIRVNPLDMEVLSEAFRGEFAHLTLTLMPDSAIERGGCVVESEGTIVDATVGQRWRKTVAALGLDISWETVDANP